MLLVFLMLVVLAGGLMLDWPRRRIMAMLAGMWLAGFLLTLILPAELARRVLGWEWPAMLIATAAGGLIWAYRRLITSARRRSGVEALRDEAELARAQGTALQADLDAERARNRAEAVRAGLRDKPAAPATTPALVTESELDRYARHIMLREIGGTGQRALRGSRVLIVGAGGLGAPVCLYLAGAGVGRITVADPDRVEVSNLHRQVIFTTADAAAHLPKAEAAARAMRALNPHIAVTPLTRAVTEADTALIAQHDLVIDGTDSFAARAGLNRACVAAGVALLSGAIGQWDGQISLFDPARGAPCLACLFPDAPSHPADCAQGGVAGPLPGVIGSLMALEAVKTLTGAGEDLRGRLLIWDGLGATARTIAAPRSPACPVCGSR